MAKEVTEIIIELTTIVVEQKAEIQRLTDRISDLREQSNDLYAKLQEKEQHLNVGPSYEDMENALLTEQEHNGNLTKEVDRLTAILRERDAEIAKLQMMVPELKHTNINLQNLDKTCVPNVKCKFLINSEISMEDFSNLREAANNGGKYVDFCISSTALVKGIDGITRAEHIDCTTTIEAVEQPTIAIINIP